MIIYPEPEIREGFCHEPVTDSRVKGRKKCKKAEKAENASMEAMGLVGATGTIVQMGMIASVETRGPRNSSRVGEMEEMGKKEKKIVKKLLQKREKEHVKAIEKMKKMSKKGEKEKKKEEKKEKRKAGKGGKKDKMKTEIGMNTGETFRALHERVECFNQQEDEKKKDYKLNNHQPYKCAPPPFNTGRANLSAWFMHFDCDYRGSLNRDEVVLALQHTLASTGSKSDPQTIKDIVYRMWPTFDRNGSGSISLTEFSAAGGFGEHLVAMRGYGNVTVQPLAGFDPYTCPQPQGKRDSCASTASYTSSLTDNPQPLDDPCTYQKPQVMRDSYASIGSYNSVGSLRSINGLYTSQEPQVRRNSCVSNCNHTCTGTDIVAQLTNYPNTSQQPQVRRGSTGSYMSTCNYTPPQPQVRRGSCPLTPDSSQLRNGPYTSPYTPQQPQVRRDSFASTGSYISAGPDIPAQFMNDPNTSQQPQARRETCGSTGSYTSTVTDYSGHQQQLPYGGNYHLVSSAPATSGQKVMGAPIPEGMSPGENIHVQPVPGIYATQAIPISNVQYIGTLSHGGS